MSIDRDRQATESAISQLAESLKWVLAAGGATAALVAGGLQLAAPGVDDGATLLAMSAALTLALGLPFAAILTAASVLGKRRLSAAELAHMEVDENRISGRPITASASAHSIVTWIQDDNGPVLLGSSSSVTDLIQRSQHGDETTKRDATERLGLIESSVHLHRTQLSFNRLFWHAKWAAPTFVLAIGTLALVPHMRAVPQQANVSDPLPVRVVVKDHHAAGLPSTCGDERFGFAVGGTFDDPRLVLEATGSCAAIELDDADGLVVFPQ